MQSNDTKTELQNEPISVEDLTQVLMAAGWVASQNKSYWKVLSKDERVVTIALENNDHDMKCIDLYTGKTMFSLSKISTINPYPLMTILHSYGIVSLEKMAIEEDVELTQVIRESFV